MDGFGLEPDLPPNIQGSDPLLLDTKENSRYAQKQKVLIIDDDEGTRQTFERILHMEGIEALATATGKEGIELAKLVNFDVIVIDLRLTDMSGTEVISALCDLCSARLVLMSAFLTVQTAVDAMRLGACDVLEKPLDIERLLAAVRAGAHEVDVRLLTASRERPSYERVTSAPRSVVERWVGYVIKVCDATAVDTGGDFRTLEEWARRVGVSYSTLCETSCLLGIRPLDARDFARVLKALRAAIAHRCAPDVLLNVSGRRVVRTLSLKAGVDLEIKATNMSLQEFLVNQRFIHEGSEALRLVRVLTSDWSCTGRGARGRPVR